MAAPTRTRQQLLRDASVFASFSVDDVKRARQFYGETLGLDVSEDKDMGLNLRLHGGTNVFIYPKDNHQPAGFTVLNFEVPDLDATMEDLRSREVRFEIYKNGPVRTDDQGVFSQGGHRMAWFTDPAGNVLSVIQER
jgi:predicted enzyme related to lactoylglutathione lyase